LGLWDDVVAVAVDKAPVKSRKAKAGRRKAEGGSRKPRSDKFKRSKFQDLETVPDNDVEATESDFEISESSGDSSADSTSLASPSHGLPMSEREFELRVDKLAEFEGMKPGKNAFVKFKLIEEKGGKSGNSHL
jgi:hypothetical protein